MKKLSLKKIEVQSFVTTSNNSISETVKGGGTGSVHEILVTFRTIIGKDTLNQCFTHVVPNCGQHSYTCEVYGSNQRTCG